MRQKNRDLKIRANCCLYLIVRSTTGQSGIFHRLGDINITSVDSTGPRQPTLNVDAARGDGLASGISGATHVGAAVLGIGVEDVQGNETEVISGTETMA